jgi:6-phosphogluconate dehydrogenase (decarboxylating)
MLPAGKITEATIEALSKLMESGDVIIDGGNTFWQDDVRRGKTLKERGIHYIDVGTSGGVWGIERGYCMMIGGDKAVVDASTRSSRRWRRASAISRAPAGARDAIPGSSRAIFTPARSAPGTFVKMVHNGIEYGLMQAYAEGFDILKNANIDALPAGASLRSRYRRHRRGVAARQRDPVLAARPHRVGARQKSRRWIIIRALSKIPAKAAGPSMPRSTRPSRPKC